MLPPVDADVADPDDLPSVQNSDDGVDAMEQQLKAAQQQLEQETGAAEALDQAILDNEDALAQGELEQLQNEQNEQLIRQKQLESQTEQLVPEVLPENVPEERETRPYALPEPEEAEKSEKFEKVGESGTNERISAVPAQELPPSAVEEKPAEHSVQMGLSPSKESRESPVLVPENPRVVDESSSPSMRQFVNQPQASPEVPQEPQFQLRGDGFQEPRNEQEAIQLEQQLIQTINEQKRQIQEQQRIIEELRSQSQLSSSLNDTMHFQQTQSPLLGISCTVDPNALPQRSYVSNSVRSNQQGIAILGKGSWNYSVHRAGSPPMPLNCSFSQDNYPSGSLRKSARFSGSGLYQTEVSLNTVPLANPIGEITYAECSPAIRVYEEVPLKPATIRFKKINAEQSAKIKKTLQSKEKKEVKKVGIHCKHEAAPAQRTTASKMKFAKQDKLCPTRIVLKNE